MAVFSTRILPGNVLDTLKRLRPIYAVSRKARFAIGSRMGSRYVPALESRAHYNDFMLTSTDLKDVESYRRGAVEFVETLKRSVEEAGQDWRNVKSCLEIGCGYGRVIRELSRALPPEAISVCDVIDEGAQFTAKEFGVKRVEVIDRLGKDHDRRYDLVYLLSVYTHLPRDVIVRSLKKVSDLLADRGVLVFTIHGRISANKCEIYNQYWLNKNELISSLNRDGFYYRRYPYYYDDYGLIWIEGEEVKNIVAEASDDLEFVAHHPAIVDEHQDTFIYRKRAAN